MDVLRYCHHWEKLLPKARVEIFPKSSPFIKFAILPKKRPMGASTANNVSKIKKIQFILILEKTKVAIITPNNPP